MSPWKVGFVTPSPPLGPWASRRASWAWPVASNLLSGVFIDWQCGKTRWRNLLLWFVCSLLAGEVVVAPRWKGHMPCMCDSYRGLFSPWHAFLLGLLMSGRLAKSLHSLSCAAVPNHLCKINRSLHMLMKKSHWPSEWIMIIHMMNWFYDDNK